MVKTIYIKNTLICLSFMLFLLVVFLGGVLINKNDNIAIADTYDSANGNFVISTLADLNKFASEVNSGSNNCFLGKTITLGSNIDCAKTFPRIATNSSYPFKGIFDGMGYSISNIYYSGKGYNNLAFMTYIDGATLKNFTIDNLYLYSSYAGSCYISSLVYSASNEVLFDNVSVTNSSIEFRSSNSAAAGRLSYFVWSHNGTSITFNNCKVQNSNSNMNSHAIGIVGYLYSSSGVVNFNKSKFLNSTLKARNTNTSVSSSVMVYSPKMISVLDCEIVIPDNGYQVYTNSGKSSGSVYMSGICNNSGNDAVIKNTSITIGANGMKCSNTYSGNVSAIANTFYGTMDNVSITLNGTNAIYMDAGKTTAKVSGLVVESNDTSSFTNCYIYMNGGDRVICSLGDSSLSSYKGYAYTYGMCGKGGIFKNCGIINNGAIGTEMIYSQGYNGTIVVGIAENAVSIKDCIMQGVSLGCQRSDASKAGTAYGIGTVASGVIENCKLINCGFGGETAKGVGNALNCTLSGCTFKTKVSSEGIGGNAENCIVENCYISSGIENELLSSQSTSAYGISGKTSCTMLNCVVKNSTITAPIAHSGNSTYAYGIGSGTMTYCASVNNQIIAGNTSTNKNTASAYGIGSGTMNICYNSSIVKALGNSDSSSTASNIHAFGIGSGTIKNCLNTGDVIAERGFSEGSTNTTEYFGSTYASALADTATAYNTGAICNVKADGATGYMSAMTRTGRTYNCFSKVNLIGNCTTNEMYSGSNNSSYDLSYMYDVSINNNGSISYARSGNYTYMKDESYFKNIANWQIDYPWNLNNIWHIFKGQQVNNGYPMLMLQISKFEVLDSDLNITSETGSGATIVLNKNAPVKMIIDENEAYLPGNGSGNWQYGDYSFSLNDSILTIEYSEIKYKDALGYTIYVDYCSTMTFRNNVDTVISVVVSDERADGSADLTISYLKPDISIAFKLNGSEKQNIYYSKTGSGTIGNTSYTYIFKNNKTILTFTHLPAQINFTEFFETYYPINITYNSANAESITYGSGAILSAVITPKSGYFIHSISINGGEIISLTNRYGFAQYDTGLGVSWVVRDDFSVVLNFIDATNSINLDVILLEGKITLKDPISFDGIVVDTTEGGEARIITIEKNKTYNIVALAFSGYKFVGWSLDGGKTIIKGLNSSAQISFSEYGGKVITAVYSKITNQNTNSDTNNITL